MYRVVLILALPLGLRCFRVIQPGKESSNLSLNLILSKFPA